MIPLSALSGAALVFCLRNDTRELGFASRAVWVPLLMALGGLQAYVLHETDALRAVIVALVVAVYWTMGHGPALQGPSQTVVDDSDVIHKLCQKITGTRPGDRMGWAFWGLYMALRYVVPAAPIAVVFDSVMPLVGGALVILAYWPVAWALKRFGDTRFIGAGLAGAAFHGCLAIR